MGTAAWWERGKRKPGEFFPGLYFPRRNAAVANRRGNCQMVLRISPRADAPLSIHINICTPDEAPALWGNSPILRISGSPKIHGCVNTQRMFSVVKNRYL
jgi:hypothetical protein